MGITYIANKKGVKDFDANVADAWLLGLINQKANAKILPPLAPSDIETGYVRVPYEASKAECRAMVERLLTLTEMQVRELYTAATKEYGLWRPEVPIAEFRVYLNSWVDFLRNCDGYDSI